MIVVDTREPNYIFNLLKREVEVRYERLEVGDYVIDVNGTKVCVERKEVGDYIGSLIEGRLAKQLFNMSVEFNTSFIVIVGYVSEVLRERKFSRRAFFASLAAVPFKRADEGERGIVIPIVVESNEDLVLFLLSIHKILEKGRFVRYTYTRPVEKTGKGVQISMLTAIPGIGVETAKTLLDGRTIRDLMEMSVDDLVKIRGVGYKTAERIKKYLY